MDDKYRLLRQKLPSRQRLFSDIRTLKGHLSYPRKWVSTTTTTMDSRLRGYDSIPKVIRHTHESGYPQLQQRWIPACAGMTVFQWIMEIVHRV